MENIKSDRVGQRPTKKCSVCKETRELSEYHKYAKSKDGYCYQCVYCSQTYKKKYRQKLWSKIYEYFGGKKCNRCGCVSEYPIFEVHHIDPKQKEMSTSGNTSFEAIKAELLKCELLCANCHKITHHEMRNKDDQQKS
jgi:hypothetical protein